MNDLSRLGTRLQPDPVQVLVRKLANHVDPFFREDDHIDYIDGDRELFHPCVDGLAGLPTSPPIDRIDLLAGSLKVKIDLMTELERIGRKPHHCPDRSRDKILDQISHDGCGRGIHTAS